MWRYREPTFHPNMASRGLFDGGLACTTLEETQQRKHNVRACRGGYIQSAVENDRAIASTLETDLEHSNGRQDGAHEVARYAHQGNRGYILENVRLFGARSAENHLTLEISA